MPRGLTSPLSLPSCELYEESLDKKPNKERTPHPWRWESSASYSVAGIPKPGKRMGKVR